MVTWLSADTSGISRGTELVENYLKKKGIRGKDLAMAVLSAEESMGSLISHADEGTKLRISLRNYFFFVSADFRAEGRAYDFEKNLSAGVGDLWEEDDAAVGDVIRSIILRASTANLRYRHRNGANSVHMSVSSAKRSSLWWTLGALFAAVIAGILISLAGTPSWAPFLDDILLTPAKDMYMNALKMIVAPVVFFSITACISQFSDMRDLGRISSKVIGFYLLKSFVAVAVGIGIYQIFKPGNAALSALAEGAAATAQPLEVSLEDTITGIVPSNFLSPFLESNMLQLIFLAVLAGAAVGMAGEHAEFLRELVEAFNDLFLKITLLIIRLMPVAIFCSILSVIIRMGLGSLVSVLGMFLTFLCGLLGIVLIYCLILLASGVSPVQFFRRYGPTMMRVFSIASSNAAIPVNMEACDKRLGISPKIYSLSIPLGATINMDGTSIFLAVFSLALAKTYGVGVTGSMLLGLALSIIILSIGAPGVPGGVVICLSALLTQMNVPVEAIALVMGIGPIIGMFMSMTNCLGDVVVTTAVAKSEKLLDEKVFRGEES